MTTPNRTTTLSSMWTLLFAVSAAFASVTTVSTRTETHGIAKFIEYKKEVVLPGAKPDDISYLTDTRFVVDAGSPTEIEAFAVVQWIRGCVFSSDSSGGKVLSIWRQHFGKIIPFKHVGWQIDSDSTDPIYSSDVDDGRFALLRWNVKPSDTDAETSKFYAVEKPPHGTTFVTDLPASAFRGSAVQAQDTSLEFRTCLFKTADLLRETTPEGSGVDIAKALWCVSWDHKFVYDFKSKRMTKPSQIDPFCQ